MLHTQIAVRDTAIGASLYYQTTLTADHQFTSETILRPVDDYSMATNARSSQRRCYKQVLDVRPVSKAEAVFFLESVCYIPERIYLRVFADKQSPTHTVPAFFALHSVSCTGLSLISRESRPSRFQRLYPDTVASMPRNGILDLTVLVLRQVALKEYDERITRLLHLIPLSAMSFACSKHTALWFVILYLITMNEREANHRAICHDH